MPRDICPVKSPSREYTVMFSDKPHWGRGFISILPEQGMQTFDQRFFFSLFLLSSPGIPQQQFLPRLLAQTPHHLTQRGDNASKYTGAACYWLLNGQQEPDLNWFPLFLKINMRLIGQLQWASTAHTIFYPEQWVRVWNCGWRKMHLGISLILHGDCWHIGRSSFLEKDILFMILHIWLGINLHLSLCNLSEGMRGTPSWKLWDLGKCLHYPTKPLQILLRLRSYRCFFAQKMGKMTILKLFPNIVSHWCLLCVNLTIGFHFESFCITKTNCVIILTVF